MRNLAVFRRRDVVQDNPLVCVYKQSGRDLASTHDQLWGGWQTSALFLDDSILRGQGWQKSALQVVVGCQPVSI